jgi:hypothetical protein
VGSFLDDSRAGLAGNSFGAEQYGAHPSTRGKLLSSTNMERLSTVPETGFANRQRKVAVVSRRWLVVLAKSGQCGPLFVRPREVGDRVFLAVAGIIYIAAIYATFWRFGGTGKGTLIGSLLVETTGLLLVALSKRAKKHSN